MKRSRLVLLALVALLALTSGGWLLQQGTRRQADIYRKARLFEDVLAHVAEYYVDSLSPEQLYDLAIEGMLDKLNDPYTHFLTRREYGELRLSTTGNYGGVGIQITSADGWITVIAPIADTPAERAGIVSGDRIVEVDGASTEGWSTERAATVLRGEPGTSVAVTVLRPGIADSLRFTLTRARVHVNSVEGPMLLAPDLGYVRLSTVSETSASELAKAVDSLRTRGARAMILDLRGNPGGVLEQGVALADLFLLPGQVVVDTKGRAPGSSRTYRARDPERWAGMPLVVLVNGGTASAAEIVAGALQDHDRALVLGTPTFGKGVAYVLIPLSEAEAVTVTTSRWYTPAGRSIDRPRRALAPAGDRIAARAGARDADTAQAFRSDAGRALAASGGIHPDLVFGPDTLTDGERRFASVLGGDLPAYRDAVTRYALELKGANAVTDSAFVVTDGVLGEFLARLRARGVEMPDSIWAGARSLVSRQLGYEVVRYAFGRQAELARIARDDVQISRALALLAAARTPSELLERARGN